MNQVIIGSSVNSSFRDLFITAKAVEGRHCHPDVSFEINPGSHQVLLNVAEKSGVMNLILAGARIHQSGCLGCIVMGQAPATGTASLRTFPRNFPGRSGTQGDQVYLCSPETAVAAAIFGKITDPRKLGDYPAVSNPEVYLVNDENLLFPPDDASGLEVIMGPNIKPFPKFGPLEDSIEAEIALKVGDNITTDHIMPAGSKILPLRSNIEAMSDFVFTNVDPEFSNRCRSLKNAVVIGGENYGQGSSREHAAIVPRYLGVRAKIAKSFARIHKANLINFGILPLTFRDPKDYDRAIQGEQVSLERIRDILADGRSEFEITIGGNRVSVRLDVTDREREILLAGGLINTAT